jgi:TRAP-type C4-dicarboxylate transport system substrate-binding protein
MNGVIPMQSFTIARVLVVAATLLAGGLPALPASAEEPVKIRLGTLAPKGSSYHRALQEMAEKWRAASGAGASFIIYTDGTQGGEADMVRRMRIGQLNAALMSGVGLAEIDKGVGAIQFIPMLFRDWAEVDYARERVRTTLEQRLAEKGFVVLFWGDAGWVRYFSKDPAVHPADFKRTKMWVNASDTQQTDLMKSLGYQPVPLEVTDILPGLQTGLITALPMGTFYALAGQFDTVAKHMLDMRWAPLLGGAVITKKAWDAMSAAGRDALKAAADQAGMKVRERGRQEDQEAIEAMKKRGLTVHPATPDIEAEWRKLAEEAYPKIRGSWVPAEIFDEVRGAVQDYRKQRAK